MILALEHDRGQTDSRARSQRLSAAHHSHMIDPDWIQILNGKGKQRLPVCKGNGHCIRNVSVLLLVCHRSQISGSVLGSILQHITLSCIQLSFFPGSVLCWYVVG